ncbi:MAG: type II toxin-antitoxin system VapC family toxin [Sedimentisphaerales bacterium]
MQTAYIETSIVSYLASQPSRDYLVSACQQATHIWWTNHRHKYELYTSQLVVTEARRGNPEVSEKRLGYLKGIPELLITSEIRDMAAALIEQGALPKKAEADGLHIAAAAVHRIDLLLTWNCRHIDNPSTKPIVRSVCTIQGYRCPEICTPIELLEALNDEE